MTLDDAIVAFGQVATDDFDSIELDLRDYERLVKWLTELKLARESASSDIGLAARAVSENHQLKAENEKLRELVREAVDAASLKDMRDWRYGKRLAFLREARELGIEEDE